MKRSDLETIASTAAGERIAVVTCLPDGTQALYRGGDAPDFVPAALVEDLARAYAAGHSRRLSDETTTLFLRVYNPPRRMAIIGAVHIAQALAGMASTCGYEVTVIDPRTAFASPARFPGVNLDTRWPDEALREFAPDPGSAVITLTHDAKLDDPALRVALGSNAFYIGALGSRRTQAKRAERLREAGFGDTDIARIAGPVGLNIGARSPEEIAVSILAEVTGVYRGAA